MAQYSYALRYDPYRLKTQDMCSQAVRSNPPVFFLVPDSFKTQEMCDKALDVDPWSLNNVPDQFKTQEMYDKAVKDDPSSLQFVSDWFVTQQKIHAWYDDDYWYDNHEMIEWYDSYKKRKAQKSKIKEEILPISWYPSRVMDWCMSEDENRRWK